MNRTQQNTSAKKTEDTLSQIGSLTLTPGEIEASGQFEQIGPTSIKVIRDCTSTSVAEEAQWAPNPLHFETAAVAEREESDMIPYHGVGNSHGAAGWIAENSDAVC